MFALRAADRAEATKENREKKRIKEK